MSKSLNIAFITLEKYNYSETFILAQRTRLTGNIFFLWDMGRESEEGTIWNSQSNTTISNALKDFFIRNRIDIAFAQFGLTGVNILDACRQLSLPLVVHFHGFDAYNREIVNRYHKRYIEMFNYASCIIAVSKDMVKQLKSLGAPSGRIAYAVCGVNDMFFENNPSYRSSTFVTVGRFVGKKAPHLTIAAFKEVLSKFPKAKLVMIGTGEAVLETCIDLVYAWGIDSRVEFLGVLSPNEIKEVFNRSFCFLQHSVTTLFSGDAEGTPVAVMEASGSGLPVIATSHKGINQAIVNGKTGFLVKERDVSGMTKYMIELLENRDKAIQMGRLGKKYIKKNFSMDSYIFRLNQIIQNAVIQSSGTVSQQ